MPQPKRPPGRHCNPTKNEKTTLQKLIRWFLTKLHMTLREVFVGTLISIVVAVVQPNLPDSSWGRDPEAIKVQYYQL